MDGSFGLLLICGDFFWGRCVMAWDVSNFYLYAYTQYIYSYYNAFINLYSKHLVALGKLRAFVSWVIIGTHDVIILHF
jgi:hypothetical protein